MELEVMKKLIKKYEPGHSVFTVQAQIGERYYRNETDILYHDRKVDDETENPLRNADNRIPRNYHGLLVNQKVSYMLTFPPLLDVGSDTSTERVREVLGDEYQRNCARLGVDASNDAVAWLHYWVDDDNSFQYAVVDPKNVIPIESHHPKEKLDAVVYCYEQLDEEAGEHYTYYEYWDDSTCWMFKRKSAESLDLLMYDNVFYNADSATYVAEYHHELGEVPFIKFMNNNIGTSDLQNIKPLIDIYDKVYSGFINDLDDIQELIFVLSGYGGTDLSSFLSDLKKYKTIKVDADETGGGGVNTLSIEIPIEARNSVLEATRKAIFEQGQGFDPQPEDFGNASGVALKFMYALLDMKAGLMKTEFSIGFAKLARAICKHEGIACDRVNLTWYDNKIQNDVELAQICQQSVGIVSTRTILVNHPFVDDVDAEMEELEEEKAEEPDYDPFQNAQEPQEGTKGDADG